MASDWNLFLERKLALDLTPNESRLADALARLLLGFRRREERFGRQLVLKTSRIDHVRTLYRARDGLIEKGLLDFEPGPKGGHRGSLYGLKLSGDHVSVARQDEKPPSCRSGGAPHVAVARQRIGRKEQTPRPMAGDKTFQARVIDEYVSHGGSLELEACKGALLRSATALQKQGLDERCIIAAVRDLGREGAFPGYLKQQAEAIAEAGGPCNWQGLDLSALTLKQLSECHCPQSSKWIEYREANG